MHPSFFASLSSPLSSASSQLSTSVSGGTPKLDQRSFRALQAALEHSLDQRLVGQPLASNAINEAVEPLQGMPLHIALIEPKSELVNVSAKMLRANVVEGAVDATLQDGPDAFDAVGRNAIADIFASAVIDGFVRETRCSQTAITAMLVCVQRRAGFDARVDFSMQRFGIGSADRLRHGAATPLPHAKYRCLADSAAPGAELLGRVLVAFLAAEICLVDCDCAVQLGQVAFARLAQAPKHEPCGFLSDTNLLGELHRRDALTCRDDEVHRVNPLVQRNVRPLEDGAGADGEILFALIAAIEATLARRDPLAKAADRATRTIRPEPFFQAPPGSFLIGDHLEKLEGGNGALAHGLTLSSCEDCSVFWRGSKLYNSPLLERDGLDHRCGDRGNHPYACRLTVAL